MSPTFPVHPAMPGGCALEIDFKNLWLCVLPAGFKCAPEQA
jgi:hypothetical protein